MANSTTHLPTISASQSSKEVTANALFDAASPAMLYGRNAVTTTGLTWGYLGGNLSVAGAPVAIANGTVTMTASTTNYVEANATTGAVTVNTTAFTSGAIQLYEIVTGTITVTSYTDKRTGGAGAGGSGGSFTQAEADALYEPIGEAVDVMVDHLASVDPHPEYLTQAEADALYAPTSGGAETTTTMGALINGADAKTTPVDADMLGLMDSAASNIMKKLSWANVKAALKTYFDTLYAPVAQPYDVFTFYPGVPSNSAKMFRSKIPRAVTFAGNFSGSYFTATVSATGSSVFDIQKNGASIGTCTIAASGTTPTFATSGGTAVSFAAGDVLEIICPTTADATLANPSITLVGAR